MKILVSKVSQERTIEEWFLTQYTFSLVSLGREIETQLEEKRETAKTMNE